MVLHALEALPSPSAPVRNWFELGGDFIRLKALSFCQQFQKKKQSGRVRSFLVLRTWMLIKSCGLLRRALKKVSGIIFCLFVYLFVFRFSR
jgi:hypothetical protein